MHSSKPCSTPTVIGSNLYTKEGQELYDPTPYRKIIGSLQYLSHTRLNISFIVNKLSQFMQKSTNLHMKAVKRVLRYLKRTTEIGLHIKPIDRLSIFRYSDADWACSKDDQCSTSGYCVYFGDNMVSWSSKKQNIISRSSAESEYRALAHLSCEITWLESLLKEINFVIP